MLDLHLESTSDEVLRLERLLGRRHHATREAPRLATAEELVGGDALGDEHQRLAPGAKDLERHRVGGQLGDRDTTALDREIEQHDVGELRAQTEGLDPVDQ